MRTKHSDRSFRSIARRSGLVALPPGLIWFRLGQRVSFNVRGPSIFAVSKPSGLCRGHLLSSRGRRAFRGLRLYA